MSQKRQKCRARTKPSCEENKERKFFFGVDRELVESGQQFAVGAFSANWVGEEQMTFHGREGDDLEGSFPGVEKEVEGAADVFPVTKVEESVL